MKMEIPFEVASSISKTSKPVTPLATKKSGPKNFLAMNQENVRKSLTTSTMDKPKPKKAIVPKNRFD